MLRIADTTQTEDRAVSSSAIAAYSFFFLFCRLAERLLEKETIALPDIVEVLGPRPFPQKKELLEYLEELKERKEAEEQDAAEAADAKADSEQKEDDGSDAEQDQDSEAAEVPSDKKQSDDKK